MNEFEFELGFEELPSDDEYLDYKTAYKRGKSQYLEHKDIMDKTGILWSPLCPYDGDDIRSTHFINGWRYQQWLSINEPSIRSGDEWPTT